MKPLIKSSSLGSFRGVEMKTKSSQLIIVASLALSACQTAETGGKIVDRNRGEIVISSSGDRRSALPEGHKDPSLNSARSKLEKSADSAPKDVAVLLSLAQIQIAQEKYQDAEETCQKVLRLDIKNQEARKVLAQAAIRQNDPDRALIFLTALGEENSRDSAVLNMLGLVSMARSDSAEAMRLWKKALTINPNDISARMNLGVMYLKYRLVAQAAVHFERILKVAPNHQDARLHMAIIDGAKGQHEQAIAVYESILSKDSNNPLALYNLAVSQQAISLHDDAAKTIKAYIRTSPGRSAQTDQAFALLEDINSSKESKGEKISDKDVQELAASLDNKKQPVSSVAAKPEPASTEVAKTASAPAVKDSKTGGKDANSPKPNSLGDDEAVEDLERQLQAH